MKRTLKCPKCSGQRIWFIDPFRIPGESALGRELAVVPHQGTGSFLAPLAPLGSFELLACASCGYSELYAQDITELREDPAKGIRLVDATELPQGPFR